MQMLVALHRQSPSPDYLSIGKCLLVLEDVHATAQVFEELLAGSEEKVFSIADSYNQLNVRRLC